MLRYYLFIAAAVTALTSSISVYPQGCPVTNDPLLLDPGSWEINAGLSIERTGSSSTYGLPVLDLNYGLSSNIQLKYQLPHYVQHESSGHHNALGKSAIGIKWKLFESHGFTLAFSPHVMFNLPLGSRSNTIYSEGTDLILPVSIIKESGWNSYAAEFGHVVCSEGPGSWLYGLLYFRELNSRITFAAEVFGISENNFSGSEVFINLGTKLKLSKLFTLLLAGGKNVVIPQGGESKIIGYTGIQLGF